MASEAHSSLSSKHVSDSHIYNDVARRPPPLIGSTPASRMFESVAIVKPDHVGDLVLAAPAINRLAELSPNPVLFVSSTNVWLAQYLFPYIPVRALDFPHLAKGIGVGALSPGMVRTTFAPFRTIFVLRVDAALNRPALRTANRPIFMTVGRPDVHEVRSHAECLYGVIGHYDSDSYWPGRLSAWPSQIDRVALVVGAGFPSNRWAAWNWARLARLLHRHGCSVLLVGGPSEGDFVAMTAKIANLVSLQTFIGTAENISEMLRRLSECDVAIATDGGSGHLASLACPVLSLFTSSPYRRFAPFGRENRLITLELECSPCMNADDRQVNLCLTHECSFGILPETVMEALHAATLPPGTSRQLTSPFGAKVIFGVSHA